MQKEVIFIQGDWIAHLVEKVPEAGFTKEFSEMSLNCSPEVDLSGK